MEKPAVNGFTEKTVVVSGWTDPSRPGMFDLLWGAVGGGQNLGSTGGNGR
jgi:hypothetical protein